MLHFHIFSSVYVLLGVTSTISASLFPYVGYHTPLPVTPNFMYKSAKPDAGFSGYFYATQDVTGAGSNVMFSFGPDSKKNLNLMNQQTAPELKGHLTMMMQQESEENSVSMESFSKPEIMESEMKNQFESKNQDENSNIIEDRKELHGPSDSLENSIFQGNQLLNFPATPNYYVLRYVPEAPHYIENRYGHIGIPGYAYNNPVLRLLYQLPFVSTVKTSDAESFNDKSSSISNNMMNNQSLSLKCANSNLNNAFSRSNIATPASEYVTDPNKNEYMDKVSTSTTEITPTIMTMMTNTSGNYSDIKELNAVDEKNGNITLPIKDTDMQPTTGNNTM